jgi:glycerophosphoryl diester phosphodiesterase
MKIIAHRGASGHAPENSKTAMLKALEMNADGFEVDLQLTIDGEVVVIHDWMLERLTNGSGFVRDKTLAELKALESGKWFEDGRFSETILTLEELLEIIPSDKILNLEIKVLLGEKNGIEDKIMEILKAKGRFDDENIIISSFDHALLKRMNDKTPSIKLGLLFNAGILNIDKYIEMNELNIYSLHCAGEFFNQELAQLAKLKGMKVYIWTVNEVYEAEILKKFGVDGIITNYPDRF